MIPWVDCEGSPRALGLDQGRAFRGVIRAALGESAHGRSAKRSGLELGRLVRALGPSGAAEPCGPNAARERQLEEQVRRHFPHFWERVHGLSLGAAVALGGLWRFLREDAPWDGAAALGAHRCPPREEGEGHALELVLPAGANGGAWEEPRSPGPWIGRCCRPETGGFAFLGLGPAWLPAAVVGVNERGLAGAWIGENGASPRPKSGPAEPGWIPLPGLFLLEQCLERLDAVEKAIEWCERRAAEAATERGPVLLFADTSGAIEAIRCGEKPERVAGTESLREGWRGAHSERPSASPSRLRIRLEAGSRGVAIGIGSGPAEGLTSERRLSLLARD